MALAWRREPIAPTPEVHHILIQKIVELNTIWSIITLHHRSIYGKRRFILLRVLREDS